MIVKEHLNVSAEDFFDRIVDSVAYDASQAKGVTVASTRIRGGYSYEKVMSNKLGKPCKTKVRVTKLDYPCSYEASFSSAQGTNTVAYAVEPSEGTGIDVTYEEGFAGTSTTNDLNFKLTNLFYQHHARTRARRLLRQVEGFIQDDEKDRTLRQAGAQQD